MITRQARTMTHASVSRYYELDISSKSVETFGNGIPLIVCLHGGGAQPSAVRFESRFDDLMEENGEFMVAYPRGTTNAFGSNYYWNDGRFFDDGSSPTADDVGFINAVVDHVAADYDVDLSHVYLCGYSNGGYMTVRMMQQSNAKFAAFSPLCGHRLPTYNQAVSLGPPNRPCPMIQFSGVDDLYVKFLGGLPLIDPVHITPSLPSVATTRTAWQTQNDVPTTTTYTQQLGDALYQQYGDRGDPGEYAIWITDNAGHNWPGGNIEDIPSLGSQNTDIWAAKEMWRFFKAHTLPA